MRTLKTAFASLLLLAIMPAAHAQSADCYSVGQRVAAQKGGELVQATAQRQGDRTVCRVVVVIPGDSGQRPKRAEFVVPAN